MKTCLAIILSVLCFKSVIAQQITLTGLVTLHNSKAKSGQIQPVEGADASSKFGGTAQTNKDGIFQLEFVSIPLNSSTQINVEKVDMEVVNQRDLQDVIIGRITPVKVYLAPKGELAKAQLSLYNISEKALTKKHEELLEKLRKEGSDRQAVIADLEKSIGKALNNWYEAEEVLNKQMEAVKDRLPETVKYLASVNLDFAHETFVQAYKLFESGDIEKAIALLDENRLAQDAAEASTNIDKFKGDMEQYKIAREQSLDKVSQLVNSYRLKSESYKLLFKFDESVRVFEKAVALLEKVKNQDDAELASAYSYLGFSYTETQNFEKAEFYLEKNLQICEELFDSTSFYLALAHHPLGHLYGLWGKYEDAIEHYEIELELIKGNIGDSTVVYTFPAFALAEVYNQTGRLVEASNLMSSAYGALKTYAGMTPEMIAGFMEKLASNNNSLDYFKEAKDGYLIVIAEREKRLGTNHPKVLRTYTNLAAVYASLGEVNAALNSIEKSRNGLEKNLGKHPSVAEAYMASGVVLTKAGNNIMADEMMKKGIALYEEILGKQHPSTADAYSSYAVFLNMTGNLSTAKEFCEKALPIFETTYGVSNPKTAIIYSIQGDILHKQGDLKGGKKILERAVKVFESSSILYLDEKHSAYLSLAVVVWKLGELERAKTLFKNVVSYNEQKYGSTHPMTVTSQGMYALTLLNLGELNEAKNIYEKAVPASEIVFGPVHQNTVDYSIGYASVLTILKSYESSIAILEKLRTKGVKNQVILNNIGLNYYHLRDYEKAIDFFKLGFELDKNSLGQFLNNVGMAHAKAGNLSEANVCFEQFQSLNPNIGQPYRNWAMYFTILGDYSKALENLEKAVQLGYNNLEWIETEESLAPLRSDVRFKQIVQQLQNKK